jgi:hypothetical protein
MESEDADKRQFYIPPMWVDLQEEIDAQSEEIKLKGMCSIEDYLTNISY